MLVVTIVCVVALVLMVALVIIQAIVAPTCPDCGHVVEPYVGPCRHERYKCIKCHAVWWHHQVHRGR